VSILQRLYNLPAQAPSSQGVGFVMARVSLSEDDAATILEKYRIPPNKWGYYHFQSRRIYERIDKKFISIGWHIFDYFGQTGDGIVVLDSEL